MEHKVMAQEGNKLQLRLAVRSPDSSHVVKTSPEFSIGGVTTLQVQINSFKINDNYSNAPVHMIFLRFFKQRPQENDRVYTLKVTCNKFSITDMCFTSDSGTWHLLYQNKEPQYVFDIHVSMEEVPAISSFAPLHEDDELTDFELRGEDGDIRVHRAVLAAASPVLRRMLSGTWKETTQGHIKVSGTSKSTLQDFKNYIYLRTLPDTGLEQLLLLASYYMIPSLEQNCVGKLMLSLTAKNVCDLLEFAVKNKVNRLMLAILKCVQNGEVKEEDIREHLYGAKSDMDTEVGSSGVE